MEEPLAALAMQKIQDHLETCSHNYDVMSQTFRELRDSIKDTNKLLIGFIGGVFAVVVTFAGYTYQQSQTLSTQLQKARIANTQAIAQVPELTAQKLRQQGQ